MKVGSFKFGVGNFLVLVVVSLLIFSTFVIAGTGSSRSSTGTGSSVDDEPNQLSCRDSSNCLEIDEVWASLLSSPGFTSLGGNKDLIWNPYDGESTIGAWVAYNDKHPRSAEEEEEVVECDAKLTCDDLTGIKSNDYIKAGAVGNCGISDLVTSFNSAAKNFEEETNEKIYLTSGFRTVEEQAGIYWKNCCNSQTRICSTSCSVPTSRLGISSDLLKTVDSEDELKNLFCVEADRSYGGHTDGTALDIWHEGKSGGFVANVKKMNILQDKMQAEGFCRLTSEMWHFDYGSCAKKTTYTYVRSDTTYNPAGSCLDDHACAAENCWWDYADNEFVTCDQEIAGGGELECPDSLDDMGEAEEYAECFV